VHCKSLFAPAQRIIVSQQKEVNASPTLALWALLFGNFVIGTGVLLPNGLLNDLIAAFSIKASTAGLLILVGGIVVGFGAPIFAAISSRIDRRVLLSSSMLLYAIGHLGSALAPSFDALLVLRAIAVVGAAIFTPQAASTVGLLVPPEKRASAIAFIFIGWSAASVAGIPLGTLLSDAFGWRMVYGLMAALSLLSCLAVWLTLKPKLFIAPLGFLAWKQALATPALWLVYAVTLFNMAGVFGMSAYMAVILKTDFAATPKHISIMFAIVGLGGVLGNTIASRLVGRVSIERLMTTALLFMCLGFAGIALFWGSFWPAALMAIFWGLGSFSSNSLQQSRLVAFAPHLAGATVALNTSVVYLGQAMGSGVGGKLVDNGWLSTSPLAALGFIATALTFSLLAQFAMRPTALVT
jgi:MFS transporter, DHA1 family, inner membrane transport protein